VIKQGNVFFELEIVRCILRGDDSDRTYLRCSIRAWIRLLCLEVARERRRIYGVTSTDFK